MTRKSWSGIFLREGGLCACFACALFALGLFFVSDEARAVDEDAVVKFRKALMQETKASLQAMSLLLKGEVEDEASLALQAQILALASKRAGEAFVFRTRGLAESTTAHERVWTEQQKFQSLMEKFAKDAESLSALAAREGASRKVGSAFKALASQCKSCHDRYRTEHEH